MNVAGAVLCGGASRRMGTDKALIEIDGVVMAERAALVLEAAGCHPVVFIGGNDTALEEAGRTVYADRWPGSGPVGGVVTALHVLADDDHSLEAVIVCACDLPDLTANVVRAVVGDRAAAPADVRVAASGRLEPMLACWDPAVLPRVEQLFESGYTSLHAVIAELVSVTVAVDPAALRNANTPNDLGKRPTRSIG